MKQLRLLRENALFHSSRVLLCLILFAAVLVTGCTSEAVAVAASPAESPLATSPSPTDQRAVRYRLTGVPVDEVAPRRLGELPVMLVGSGPERERIIKHNLGVIRSGSPSGRISDAKVSPGRKWALVDIGEAGYAIASAESLAKAFENVAKPPRFPDGFDDATVIYWVIYDDDHLIGQADLPSLDPGVGMTLSEKDSLPPRDTLIYIYTLSSRTTTRAEIDGTLPRPFRISENPEGRLLILSFDDLEEFGAKIILIPEP
ncbi:hypothetical protein ABB27_16805 [Stenotrophomonas terrae]|uniref:Lipoprotein n=1 Tax=Stenotrophomonas terrae TaxID=405446 RepID=A0A0R0CDE0_9GAMM|nr:hypothetical protein [Stenotrophomonas terrae]KRG64151.1 hypothetical protein ABB27_16805 [Stenotrophomonas terrae]